MLLTEVYTITKSEREDTGKQKKKMSIIPRRLGKYELQEPLGRGGTAEVWKAFDTQLRRYVAIKLLHADLGIHPDFVSRFTREAQVVAALRHPNIVQIYDFHIAEPSAPVEEEDASAQSMIAYMVMEYIKGQTLAHYIHKTSHQENFPPAAEIIRLFTPISLALDYAHQQGTIHRDIKPANILLDQRNTARNPMGEPILSDFGFAKLLDAASQTVSGALFGTPLYISPEQIQGLSVSNRTDLYSLGVVLYEIFTGSPPFQGDSVSAIMRRHLTDIPTEPHILNPQLPTALSRVLLKSLAKNPSDRFSSAAAMTAALAEAFDLPVPQDVNRALASTDDRNISAHEASVAYWPSDSSSSLAPADAPDQQVMVSDGEGPVSGEHYLPISLPSVKEEVISSPSHLPDSEAHIIEPLNSDADASKQRAAGPIQESIASVQAASGTASESAPVSTPNPALSPSPSDTPPSPSSLRPPAWKRQKTRGALVALVILVLVGSGLGAFLLFAQRTMVATVSANPIVGHAYFMSSGQVNQATNQGSNDELQVDLQNISDPHAGKSYYAWLLPDKSQSESPAILLGKIPVNHGVVHFFYAGDSYHTNLLGITSRFLITEEDADVTPSLPSPDLTAWRYYAELPQTRAAGNTYSLLDHLRHLLASDPTLEALHLPGGLNLWTFRNTQKLLEWAGSARDEWSSKDFVSMHRQIVSILDYLDGEALVQQDVPPGTPILADRQIAQVGLLELDPARQNPPGYLYHIVLHVNGVLGSPGATQDQRRLATQIDTAMNSVKAELEQMRHDAVQLVAMSDAQLALPSSLALLDDMATQANNAYMGHNDPASGQFQMGVSQISQNVQRLATFEVKLYK